MTATAHTVEDDIILLERQRVRALEAGVEIGSVFGNVGQSIVDLPVDDGFGVRVAILESETGAASKRHLPVAVEGASWIDANGERAHGSVAAPSAGKKVSERRLDRRVAMVVPVNAQDEITPAHVGGRDPYLLDCALPFDVAKQQGLARGDAFRWRDLPAASKAASMDRAGALNGHAAFTLFARRVFRADRTRLRRRQPRQIAEMQSETREPLRHAACLIQFCPIYLMPVVLINSMMRFWKITNMTIVGSATTVEAAIT